jgi:predicted AAA+ superfamily ATPase
MIPRLILKQILTNLSKGKSIIILGPRQTGKTTLLVLLEKELKEEPLWLDCDEPDIRRKLTDTTSTQLKNLIGNHKMIFIDEAQRVSNIGITLKLFTDKLKDVQLIVTGSSSLDLANEINEPLTGRKFEFIVFPFSFSELVAVNGQLLEERMLEHRLIYGMYPDVVMNQGSEEVILKNLAGSYLYKDIFSLQEIRKPEILEKLLEALALQLGSEVSFHELGNLLRIDQNTVQKYINLLEQSFVIFRLKSFSRNHRNELKNSRKIYFFDNGIRNAILGIYTDFELRADRGALWENFLISERMKLQQIYQVQTKNWFWRTKLQQEIDYIEERNGVLNAFEFKWSEKKDLKISKSFRDAYPNHVFRMINNENYADFLYKPDFT